MDKSLSAKLRNLSFMLLWIVVFIHGYNANIHFGDGSHAQPEAWLMFFEHFISDGVCRVAVPLFFAISGFLAFYSLGEELSFSWLIPTLKKKINSLLIPYLAVSLLGILLVVVLQLVPISRPFFNNYSLETTTLKRWLFIWLVSPVPYQLWFVRFLMFYFLILPFIYGLLKYLKIAGLAFLFYTWYSFYFQEITGITKIEFEGLFFFALGGFCAMHQVPLRVEMRLQTWLLLVVIWLGWIAYRTHLLLNTSVNNLGVHSHLIGFTFVGLGLIWIGYDFFQEKLNGWDWLRRNAGYSFGVFLFHEPMLTIIKKLLIKAMGGADLSLFVAFFVVPVSAFLVALWFSRMLHRFLPKAYGFLTGNRLPSAAPVAKPVSVL